MMDLLMRVLVRGESRESAADSLGIPFRAVSDVVRGHTHIELRAECIRALRAEGHVVRMPTQ